MGRNILEYQFWPRMEDIKTYCDVFRSAITSWISILIDVKVNGVVSYLH